MSSPYSDGNAVGKWPMRGKLQGRPKEGLLHRGRTPDGVLPAPLNRAGTKIVVTMYAARRITTTAWAKALQTGVDTVPYPALLH